MSPTSGRVLGATVLLVAGSALLSACASSNAAPLSAADGSGGKHPDWAGFTFTIGDNGGDGTQALAQKLGTFDSAAYKVKFARFEYGPPLVQAAATGAIDLGQVGDVPPITGAAKEFGFKIVGVSRSLTPDQAAENIIVPKGSPITTLADLKGKRIAVPVGSSAHGLALLALKSVGLSPKDVDLVYLTPSAAATAFAGGKVDAWSIWNPQSAIAVENGAKVIAKGVPPIDQSSNYYVANDKSLKDPARRAALTDLFKRLASEFAYADRHPDVYAAALVQEEGIPLSDAKATVASYKAKVTEVRKFDVELEQTLATAFSDAGQIKATVNVAELIDNLLPSGFDSLKAGVAR